ncbi:hypothetical protein KYJ26_22485 [Bacillus sp. MCCB 382]|uniref:hypothetical protein n=1 Tax=Bacillus sp. MCCB 382 TaxID=2860197 RepID=UPI001C55CF2E|nr:hypothetical protein [Bacillus sp. MCCB 382]
MRIHTLILTGIMAGIYSSILDGIEQDYSFNTVLSACTLTVSTIVTGLLLHRFLNKEKNSKA